MAEPGPGGPALRRLGAAVAPLSFAQERLWLIDAAAPGSVTYNVPLLLRWRGRCGVAALRAALAAVVRRHEILRTTYHVRHGQPVQVVGTGLGPVEVIHDVGGTWEDAVVAATALAREPFDLSRQPPLRCAVWPGLPGGDAVLLSMHHIAIDGWSLATLFEDLTLAYAAAVAGSRAELPELPLQYADFAVWDRATMATAEMERRLSNRVAELIQLPAGPSLAGRRPPAPAPIPEGGRRGAEHVFPIPRRTWSGALELATRMRMTPFVAFLSAFAVVLQRWSGADERLVGAISANRACQELEGLVGFFVNTVPIHCRLRPEWSFADLCRHSRGESYRALTHQRLPYDQLIARAAAKRAEGHRPLVDVGFALQNVPPRALAGWPSWEAPRVLHTGTAKFDLMLVLEEREDGPTATVEHDLDRYPADVGRRVGESFLALLSAAVADPGQPLWRLPVEEREPDALPAGVLLGERRDLIGERLRRIEATVGSGGR